MSKKTHETKKITVSLRIDPEIWKSLKLEAVEQEEKISELLENILTGETEIKITTKKRKKR